MCSLSRWEGANGKGGNKGGVEGTAMPSAPTEPGSQAQGGFPRAELPGTGPEAQLPVLQESH